MAMMIMEMLRLRVDMRMIFWEISIRAEYRRRNGMTITGRSH